MGFLHKYLNIFCLQDIIFRESILGWGGEYCGVDWRVLWGGLESIVGWSGEYCWVEWRVLWSEVECV